MVSFRVGNNSDYDAVSRRSGAYTDNRVNIGRGHPSGNGRITIPLIDNNDEESKIIKSGTFIKKLISYLELEDDDYSKIVLDTGETSEHRKRDASKKHKKPKRKPSSENPQYLNPPKKAPTSSRRRQNTPLSQFNEVLVNIVDSCITFDNTRMFHQPVKKSDAPTYYDIIKNPMDLSTLKAKAKRCEYKSLAQFQEDMQLMKSNSEAFNGPSHFITQQAANIIERADLLITADFDQLKDLETKAQEEVDA